MIFSNTMKIFVFYIETILNICKDAGLLKGTPVDTSSLQQQNSFVSSE
jgi:hypothetical protein